MSSQAADNKTPSASTPFRRSIFAAVAIIVLVLALVVLQLFAIVAVLAFQHVLDLPTQAAAPLSAMLSVFEVVFVAVAALSPALFLPLHIYPAVLVLLGLCLFFGDHDFEGGGYLECGNLLLE